MYPLNVSFRQRTVSSSLMFASIGCLISIIKGIHLVFKDIYWKVVICLHASSHQFWIFDRRNQINVFPSRFIHVLLRITFNIQWLNVHRLTWNATQKYYIAWNRFSFYLCNLWTRYVISRTHFSSEIWVSTAVKKSIGKWFFPFWYLVNRLSPFFFFFFFIYIWNA